MHVRPNKTAPKLPIRFLDVSYLAKNINHNVLFLILTMEMSQKQPILLLALKIDIHQPVTI